MQEELEKRTMALVFTSSKTGIQLLGAMGKAWLTQYGRRSAAIKAQRAVLKEQNSHGKITVQELVGQGQGASSIEIKDKDIKSFERVVQKYNIDFAIHQDKTQTPPKYLVFFKAKDTDVVSQAFREYMANQQQQKKIPSLHKKLTSLKQKVEKQKQLLMERQRNRQQGGPTL